MSRSGTSTGATPRGNNGTPRAGTTSAVDSPVAMAPAVGAASGMLMEGFGTPRGIAGGNGMGMSTGGSGFTPVAMQMSVSQGGLSSIGMGMGISGIMGGQEAEEERRRRRMKEVVGMIGARGWGFVSLEGVERGSRRLGMDFDEGAIAGVGVIVEVGFGEGGKGVRGVEVMFEGSGEGVRGRARGVAECLRGDLLGRSGEGEGVYVGLGRFVGNLERLARMDRCGGRGVSCFDAVEGLGVGLERVFEWERGRAEGEEVEVMSRGSGRPRWHVRGRVGLALQYWMDRRLLVDKEKEQGEEEMDVDITGANEDEEENSIWSAIIECEVSSADIYPPIKVSDAWVSEVVEKPAPIENDVLPMDSSPIDWQEPPPTVLSPESPTNGAMNINSTISLPRQPDARFVAKFEPAVIVPLPLALQIHESVGSPLLQESLLPTTYENLLFEDVDAGNPPLATPRTLEKTVSSYDPAIDTFSHHKHKYTLFTQPQDFARAITSLPFAHPRQIIAILPTLRQWALTASILRRTFIPSPSPEIPTSKSTSQSSPPSSPKSKSKSFLTIDAELADFISTPLPNDPLSSSSSNPLSKTKDIQISLTTTPVPRMVLHFPNQRYGGKLASVGFNVGLNGGIEGVDVDDGGWEMDGGGEGGKGIGRVREGVRRCVEVGEEVGVVVEWVCGGGKVQEGAY